MSTAGYVKLLLPPRQSRGNSHWGLEFLFDHFVGTQQDRGRQLDADRLGGLQIHHHLELVGCSIGKSAGWAPRAIRSTNSATRPKSAVMLGP